MITPTITPPLPDLDLCLVKGGEFMMGDDSSEYDNEKPAHPVRLSGFWMGKYPVTQRLWQAVMGYNPSYFKGERHPVEFVSWNDAHDFLRKLNELQEVQAFIRQLNPPSTAFRLPTEAEWEYAARGGRYSQGYKYAGSDRANQVAWHRENSANETQEVGLLLPNELGIYDMSGNVWEWCADCYFYKYYAECYQHGIAENPQRNSQVGNIAVRGGSSPDEQLRCVVVRRLGVYLVNRTASIGFRIVLPL